MEEGDVFLVIVDDKFKTNELLDDVKIKEEIFSDDETPESLLELLESCVQSVKQEPEESSDEEFDNETFLNNLDAEAAENEANHSKQRYKMRSPTERISLVKMLQNQHDNDDDKVVDVLVDIMKSVKAPSPPSGYFSFEGAMYKCSMCGTLTSTEPAASRHFQEKHGPRYLVCYACGVDFRSTTNLYKHEKRCIAEHAPIVLQARARFVGSKGRSRPFLIPKEDQIAVQQTYACTECPSVFFTKVSLEAHSNHHKGLRPFHCHVCPNAYTSSSALFRHMKIHSSVCFICDHCSRMFKVKSALITHMDTHLPLKKFACAECGKRYAQKHALTLHVNSKHRLLPPPCACQICPRRFPRMSVLKEHMKKAHGMAIVTRKMFFKTLPTLSDNQLRRAKVIKKSDINNEYSTDFMYDPILDISLNESNIKESVNPQDLNDKFNMISDDNVVIIQLDEDNNDNIKLEMDSAVDTTGECSRNGMEFRSMKNRSKKGKRPKKKFL